MSHSSPHILLVDDEPDILELLSMTIDRMGLMSDTAASVKKAIAKLNSRHFDLCLTDLRLPDGSGLEIVNYIQQSMPQLPVAVISAHGNMQAAIDAMKTGAFDFVSKPIDLNQLRELIESALALDDSSNDKKCNISGPSLLGQSATVQSIRAQIKRLARNMAPVHIHGESGTGKELVARLIHSCSPRKEKPFIAVNSSAIPTELMESEFFGHLKGSFTGAVTDKPGLFQAANGGTLFLDEIADLPLTMQAKLLRAIQERAIRPVGAHDEIGVNIRILSATHQDLHKLVSQGKFREDLYYRINVIELDVPPLRERKEDIPLLTEMILSRIAERNQATVLTIDQSALDSLQHYSFPGNIRELENILERASALCEQDCILASDLSLTENVSRAGSKLTPDIGESLDDFLMRIERKLILEALNENKNNKTRTAEKLGISFRSLRYKLKKLGIDNQ